MSQVLRAGDGDDRAAGAVVAEQVVHEDLRALRRAGRDLPAEQPASLHGRGEAVADRVAAHRADAGAAGQDEACQFLALAELADLLVGLGGVAEDQSLLGNAGTVVGDAQHAVGPPDGGVRVLVQGVGDQLAQRPHRSP